VTATLPTSPIGPYQLQAAIAAVHDEATRAEDTDWRQIVAIYGVLMGLEDNPMVALNHAIAVAMVDGPAAGLALLSTLDADERVAGHYRLDAVRGHLYRMAGERDRAAAHFRAAAERTASAPERDYLTAKAAQLATGERT
jgi:predicted RNA polymerase sigma factor